MVNFNKYCSKNVCDFVIQPDSAENELSILIALLNLKFVCLLKVT